VTEAPTQQLEDEQQLVRLLDRYHAAADEQRAPKRQIIERVDPQAPRYHAAADEQRALEWQIIELVDRYFRRSLRPWLIRKFGSGVADTNCDSSVRYTDMAHNFFERVLEKRPDEFWKARTARDLRAWASVVMANQMLDYLRRKKRGKEILVDQLAPLVEERQRHFESRFGVEFERALDQIDAWAVSHDDTERMMASVLRHRYVDGMPYDEIAEQLGVSVEEVERLYDLRDRAMKILRERYGTAHQ